MQAPLGCLRGGAAAPLRAPRAPTWSLSCLLAPSPLAFCLPFPTEMAPICPSAGVQLAATPLLFWGARPYFRDRLQRKWKETGRGRRSPPRGRSVRALQPS